MLANSFFSAADDIGGTGSTNLTMGVLTNQLNLKSIHHTHKNKYKYIYFFIFKRRFFTNQASFEEITSSSAFTEDFGNQLVFHVNVGSCVTAPPFTAGLQVRFTVAVMAGHTL